MSLLSIFLTVIIGVVILALGMHLGYILRKPPESPDGTLSLLKQPNGELDTVLTLSSDLVDNLDEKFIDERTPVAMIYVYYTSCNKK